MTPRSFILFLEATDRYEFLAQKYIPLLIKKVYGRLESESTFFGNNLRTVLAKCSNCMPEHLRGPAEAMWGADEDLGKALDTESRRAPVSDAGWYPGATEMSQGVSVAGLYFQAICTIDPAVNSMRQAGGYTEWILKRFLTGNKNMFVFLEDGYKIRENLTIFSRIKGQLPLEQRDVNKIADPETLYQLILPFKATVKKTRVEVTKDISVLLDTPEVSIYIPRTYEASRRLGGDTQWCTASSREYYFKDHSSQGPLFVIFLNGGKEKFQVHFETHQCMDEHDDPAVLKDMIDEHPIIGQVLAKHMVDVQPSGFIENLHKIGAGHVIDQMFKDGQLTAVDVEDVSVTVSVGLYARGFITLPELQAIRRPHDGKQTTFEEGRVCLSFDSWTDPDLLQFFSDGFRTNSRRGASMAFDGTLFDGRSEDLETPMRDYWGHIDAETMAQIKKLLQTKGANESGDMSPEEVMDAVDDEDDEILQAIQWGMARAETDAHEEEAVRMCISAIEEVLGPHEFVDRLCFYFTYENFLSFVDGAGEDASRITQISSLAAILDFMEQNRDLATFDSGEVCGIVDWDNMNHHIQFYLADIGER